ncbi:MAG: histidine kinase N-terminal 7TM domain-containing protein [Haloplanus sp.]
MLHTMAALHLLLLIVSAGATATLARYALRHRDTPGTRPFALLMSSTAIWAGSYAVGLVTLAPRWRVFWQSVQWFPIATIPVWFLLFALEYTGNDDLATPRVAAGLLVLPAVTVLLVWTNAAHGLIWTENRVLVIDGLALMREIYGPWFWVYTVYGYGMVLLAAGFIARLVFLSDSLFADQAALLLVGTVVPLAASAASVLSVQPLPGLDMGPYGLVVTGITWGYALFRHDLFGLVPAAHRLGRDAAIRDLEDGVLIVDTDEQVIYCNAAAADLLDRQPVDVLGEEARSLVDDTGLDFDTEDALAELERDGEVFEIRTSPIRDRRDRVIGHTVIVQEITARKRRERRVARQRAELERLEGLNAVIRGVHRALVSATSRTEIERAVCERLAESERFRAACVADLPTWNGNADRWTVAGDSVDETSLPAALCDDEVTVTESSEIPAVASVPDEEETWTVVPLVYGRTVYGALGLCPRDGDGPAVTDREREVLAELGEVIGHAIDAVENRRLLAAESIIELDLRSRDDAGPLLATARQADCALAVSGVVPNAGDGHLAYVQVTAGTPEAAADTLESVSGTEVRPIRSEENGDTPLVEWRVPPDALVGALLDQGVQLLRASADGGGTRLRVEVAGDADVRALMNRLQERFPRTRIEAKRERSRPTDRADTVVKDAIEDLTDRQQEALEAAYRAGYFSWPRESTAEEVAESLDISAPTLHAHLRKAEDGLLADLFDEMPARRE